MNIEFKGPDVLKVAAFTYLKNAGYLLGSAQTIDYDGKNSLYLAGDNLVSVASPNLGHEIVDLTTQWAEVEKLAEIKKPKELKVGEVTITTDIPNRQNGDLFYIKDYNKKVTVKDWELIRSYFEIKEDDKISNWRITVDAINIGCTTFDYQEFRLVYDFVKNIT